MQALRDRIPDHAKDLRLNLDALWKSESLSPTQLWVVALATALATRQDELARGVAAEARAHLDGKAFEAARTAAALMGMNNVYYRSLHLLSNPEYGSLPARLRMQGLASHGIERVDFELACLAVSAVNGCGKCLDSHEHELRQRGATALQVQDALRIAAVLSAIAAVLDGARALATESEPVKA
ncbi:MAG TPA: carboxymuconolactone decarboxylase family protein [Planctomycetota bacterium]